MKSWNTPIAIVTILAAFLIGWWLGRDGGHSHGGSGTTIQATANAQIWTCSMHPQVRQPGPGSCPLCGMALIPVSADDDDEDREAPRLRLSERAQALMDIRTAPVRRAPAEAHLNLPGRLAYDESRYTNVHAWFSGRVDRLFASQTGVHIQPGDRLAEIYSPELHGAQEEYLQARNLRDSSLREVARERLRLLGVSDAQLAELEESGHPSTHLVFHAPAGGTIVSRAVTAGQYVQTGDPLLVLSDLGSLWLNLEAYAADLAWLRYGQKVGFRVESFPGEEFEGRIAFIDPAVDEQKRTARVRINVANPDGRLKPGMLAQATIAATAGADGRVRATAELSGKWISPLHPEIIRDGPGDCDICGNPLVPVEELGYPAVDGGSADDPLLVPASALLVTGKRALVYVRLPEGDPATFEAREIEPGPRLGDAYLVRSGLVEGDVVVTHGQFKIDSELQIRGRPSMMAPAETTGDEPTAAALDFENWEPPVAAAFASQVPADFGDEVSRLIEAHLTFATALADDEPDAARAALDATATALRDMGQHRLTGPAHAAWMEQYSRLETLLQQLATESTIDGLRAHLQALTLEMERTLVDFGAGRISGINHAYCPMAFNNRGASWLQRGETIHNPYFGAVMLTCGEFLGSLP